MKYKAFYSCINPDLAWISTAGCVGRMDVTSRRREREPSTERWNMLHKLRTATAPTSGFRQGSLCYSPSFFFTGKGLSELISKKSLVKLWWPAYVCLTLFRRRPPTHRVNGEFRVSQITVRVLSTVQQVSGPLRWRTACLTERLPLRCLSRWARSGRIWLEAVITSIFQNELHLMTSWDILNARQCFLVQVSDGAVQQRLYGQEKERKVVFSEMGQDSGVLEPLTCSWT